jgi:hypothetical protein
MFDEIQTRVERLRKAIPENFKAKGATFHDVPDAHTVAVVCSHLGKPLYAMAPGPYQVHDDRVQVNPEPLDRYKRGVEKLITSL